MSSNSQPARHRCGRTDGPVVSSRSHAILRWVVLPTIGLLSLVWVLVRCLPKPSRANYPCQRAAAPLAFGFVTWVVGLIASGAFLSKARAWWRDSRHVWAALAVVSALVAAGIAATGLPDRIATAGGRAKQPANEPIGIARGIHPGRVVWVRDASALDWDGETIGLAEGYWNQHTDAAAVEWMLSRALRGLTGETTDRAAWEMLFRHFNETHGRGDVGYQAGESVNIKVNLTTTAGDTGFNIAEDGEQIARKHYVAPSMELTHALLDQLVNVVGVAQSHITIGDTTGSFPNHFYDYLVKPIGEGGGGGEFVDVVYINRLALPGRVTDTPSDVAIHWSTSAADQAKTDFVPLSYVDAAYFINVAILKTHARAGVTLTGKNLYGSLIRRPTDSGYYPMHTDLASESPDLASYRNLVDLMGHAELGGKSLLGILDGLWTGYDWADVSSPLKWQSAPFDNSYCASLLLSQDMVALDSVGYDLWYAEAEATSLPGPDPQMAAADDYLHEAAEADDPPSGTLYDPEGDGTSLSSLGVHEHWNSEREYSRNLGIGDGIELVKIGVEPNTGETDGGDVAGGDFGGPDGGDAAGGDFGGPDGGDAAAGDFGGPDGGDATAGDFGGPDGGDATAGGYDGPDEDSAAAGDSDSGGREIANEGCQCRQDSRNGAVGLFWLALLMVERSRRRRQLLVVARHEAAQLSQAGERRQ